MHCFAHPDLIVTLDFTVSILQISRRSIQTLISKLKQNGISLDVINWRFLGAQKVCISILTKVPAGRSIIWNSVKLNLLAHLQAFIKRIVCVLAVNITEYHRFGPSIYDRMDHDEMPGCHSPTSYTLLALQRILLVSIFIFNLQQIRFDGNIRKTKFYVNTSTCVCLNIVLHNMQLFRYLVCWAYELV